MSDPLILTDHERMAELARRRRSLEPTALGYTNYQKLKAQKEEAEQVLAEEADLELRELALEQRELATTELRCCLTCWPLWSGPRMTESEP